MQKKRNPHPLSARIMTAMAVVVIALVGCAAAAEHSPGMENLIATAEEGGTIPVILYLDGRLTMDDVYPIARSLPMDARRKYIVETLRNRFHDMGDAVMASLEDGRKNGDVTLLRPLWILNAIRVRISPSFLKAVEENHPEVVYIGADPRYENTLDNIGWGMAEMDVPEVWRDFGADGSGVIVGHKDSGIDYTHPGFAGHLWLNSGEDINHNGILDAGDYNSIDDDGNGYVDDFYGWNFDDDNSNVGAREAHGTKTASVVSANFSPCDTVSVAPGAKLMVLSAYEYQGSVWEASQYAVEMGAHVITASLSFKHSECADMGVRECPNYVGHRIVSEMELAAGLLHSNSTGNEGQSNAVPFSAAAPSNCPPPVCTADQPQQGGVSSIIAVAAYNISGSWEFYSGHGPSAWSRADICIHARMPFCGSVGSGSEYPADYNDYPFQGREFPGLIRPDITAPTSVTSLSPGGSCGSIGGTSGATPHVGAVCALIFSAFPGITPEEAFLLLVGNALDQGTAGLDTLWGYGKLRPYAAIQSGTIGRAVVSGTVNANGSPLIGARVFLEDDMGVFSDDIGHYELSVPPGTHTIYARALGYTAAPATVTVSAGQTLAQNFDLTQTTTSSLSGTVSGEGQPLGGITVSIPEYNLFDISNPDGFYNLPLPAESYEILVSGLPWADYTQTITVTANPVQQNIVLTRSPRAFHSGPDQYGYYIYDPYDTPQVHYSWVEIDPALQGFPGQELNVGNDASVVVNLPFSFSFYGSVFTQITVCANGFIIPGMSSSTEWSSFPIPSISPPNGYLAPWFSDWEPQNGNGVFYYSQTDSHRVIIEWSHVPDYDDRGFVSFQAILYNPQFDASPGGDAIVIYQYQSFNDLFEGTIGLENLAGTDGVEYMFLSMYDPAAAPLEDGSALLITTDSALAMKDVESPAIADRFVFAQNWPNPFNPQTTFLWSVPRDAHVRIALYDILGREAAVIFDGISAAGEHRVHFDGSQLSTGVYFAKMDAAGQTIAVRKTVLLK